MILRRLGPLAVVMFASLASTGCVQALEVAFKVTGAVIEAAATSPSRGGGSSACCYSRESATPVEGAVDRPMSECELDRGRWRETHQDQDDVPAELRCLGDGSYPVVSAPPPALTSPAAPVEAPVVAPVEASSASAAAASPDSI